MGYKVVTTASPHSTDLLKQYGADAVVDYHDVASALAKIKDVTGGGVSLGMDCISLGDSFEISLNAFKQEGGEQLNLVLPPSGKAGEIRTDIKKPFTLMYSLLGNVSPHRPSS